MRQGVSLAVSQIMTYQVRGRGIHQVPVIDEPGIGQVEMVDFGSDEAFALIIMVNQNKEGQQTVFVKSGPEQASGLRHRQLPILFSQFSQDRDPNTPEAVALAVLSRAGLKKAL